MTTINIFRHDSQVESFAAGEAVITAGETGETMYVVVSGEVEIVINGAVIDTVGEGGVVGEMALIDGNARSATAVAKTDCTLAPVDRKRFAFLVQQTPYFALQVMQVLADRLRRTNAALV